MYAPWDPSFYYARSCCIDAFGYPNCHIHNINLAACIRSFTALMPPGLALRCGDAIRKPVGRLHFAGSETAQRCVGYLEGGLEAGLRVAREVIAAISPR